MKRRADELMTEVSEEHRLAVYASALEDFAAHLLSIRHEIGRQQRRRGAGELCELLDHPATLFGFWRRAVEEGTYPGYLPRATQPTRGRLGLTRAVLVGEDKAWLMQEVLGTDWTGDPREDFRDLCSG